MAVDILSKCDSRWEVNAEYTRTKFVLVTLEAVQTAIIIRASRRTSAYSCLGKDGHAREWLWSHRLCHKKDRKDVQ